MLFKALEALRQIATSTRGSYAQAEKPSDLVPLFDALGHELSRQYLLSYQSLAGPGAHVNVRVKVRRVVAVGRVPRYR